MKQLYASQAKIINEIYKISDCRAAIADDELVVHFNKRNKVNLEPEHVTWRFHKSPQLFLEMK